MIVLHADTKQGDVFYTANGFVKGDYIRIESLQTIIEIAIQKNSYGQGFVGKSIYLKNR